MDYEIVNLEEKTLVSLKPIKLLNSDPEISNKIKQLWHSLDEKISEFEDKIKGSSICMFSNFKSGEPGFFEVVIGFEFLEKFDFPKIFEIKTVPAGQYAKFVIKGNVNSQLARFWSNLHTLNLPRKHNDFYRAVSNDITNDEVHIFIGLK